MPFRKDGGFICDNCGALLAIESCLNCGRLFVYTQANLQGRKREYDDLPLSLEDGRLTNHECDYCAAEERGDSPSRGSQCWTPAEDVSDLSHGHALVVRQGA